MSFALDPDEVLAQAVGGRFVLDLPERNFNVDVQPYPFAVNALVGRDGTVTGTVSRITTFLGSVDGSPAVLAATTAGVFLLVLEDEPLLIEPLWLSVPGAAPNLHRLVAAGRLPSITLPAHVELQTPYGGSKPLPPAEASPEPTNRIVHLLVEGDHAFYQKATLQGACPECWVDVQQALLLLAQVPFERQIGVRFDITSQWVCTTAAACPYTGNDVDAMLETFRSRWETRADEAFHELGHLMTGVDLVDTSGKGYIATVATPFGYSLSEFATPGSALQIQHLIAHEIGHNFNGVHSEADVVPPTPLNASPFVTIMWGNGGASKNVRLAFSDGSWDPTHNNAARIIAHASQQLPPP